jgi:hypothetical protein
LAVILTASLLFYPKETLESHEEYIDAQERIDLHELYNKICNKTSRPQDLDKYLKLKIQEHEEKK